MKLVRSFFNFTRIFWIISRLVLGLIFSYCAIFLLEGADTQDYISAGFFGIFGISLLWGFVAGLWRGQAHKWLRISTGIVLIVLALAMIYSTIDVFGMKEAALILLLPLWLFMAGLFELTGIKGKKFANGSVPPMDVRIKA